MIEARGILNFGRDWLLRISGNRVARFQNSSGIYEADLVEVRPVAQAEPALVKEDNRPSSWIGLVRGRAQWPHDLATGSPSPIVARGGGFDRIQIEAREEDGEIPSLAILMHSEAPDAQWHLTMGSNLTTADDDNRLRLVGLKQVSLIDGDDHHAATIANLPMQPQKVVTGNLTLAVAGNADDAAVVIESRNGTRTRCDVAPVILSTNLPLGDGLIATSRVPHDSSIFVLFDTEPCPCAARGCSVPSSGQDGDLFFSEITTTVIRPLDLLKLEFTFYNFSYRIKDGVPHLFPVFPSRERPLPAPNDAPTLKVTFDPQHSAEKAVINLEWPDTVDVAFLGDALIPACSKRESQIVFDMPLDYAERGIPCSLEGFLDWRDFQMKVAPNALPEKNAPPPLLPASWQSTFAEPRDPPADPIAGGYTALALPAFLYLSPHQWSTWHHARAPVDLAPPSKSRRLGDPAEITIPRQPVTELWHTRLGVYRGEDLDLETGRPRPRGESSLRGDLMTVRAIWAANGACPPPGNHTPTLNPNPLPTLSDAAGIVLESADFTQYLTNPDTKRAIPYSRVMLSSQGATLRLGAAWNPSEFGGPDACSADIDAWVQDVIWGRDQGVLVSHKGYNYMGHPISLIWIREREIRKTSAGGFTAVLVERYYCESKEPHTVYYSTPIDYEDREGRRWPIVSAEILPPYRTPYLNPPHNLGATPTPAVPDACIMYLEHQTIPYSFHIRLTDVAGNKFTISQPLLWFNMNIAETQRSGCGAATPGALSLDQVLDLYCQDDAIPGESVGPMWLFRSASVDHDKISYAVCPDNSHLPPNTPKMDATIETEQITTTVELLDLASVDPDDENKQTSTWYHSSECKLLKWPLNEPRNKSIHEIWPLRFYPALTTARLRLQAVDGLGAGASVSGASSPTTPTTLLAQFNEDFRAYGLTVGPVTPGAQPGNRAAIIFDIPDNHYSDATGTALPNQAGFKMPGGKSAGLVVPALATKHYSATIGPIGGNESIALARPHPPGQPLSPLQCPAPAPPLAPLTAHSAVTGSMNAEGLTSGFFSNAGLVCGAIELSQIIAPVGADEILEAFAKIPQLIQEAKDDIDSIRQEATQVRAIVDGIVVAINGIRDIKRAALDAGKQVGAQVMKDVTDDLLSAAVDTIPDAASAFAQYVVAPIECWCYSTFLETLFAVKVTYDDAVKQAQQDNSDVKEIYGDTLDLLASYRQTTASIITWKPWQAELQSYVSKYNSALSNILDSLLGGVDELAEDFQQFIQDLTDPQALLGDLPQLLDTADAVTKKWADQLAGDIAQTLKDAIFGNPVTGVQGIQEMVTGKIPVPSLQRPVAAAGTLARATFNLLASCCIGAPANGSPSRIMAGGVTPPPFSATNDSPQPTLVRAAALDIMSGMLNVLEAEGFAPANIALLRSDIGQFAPSVMPRHDFDILWPKIVTALETTALASGLTPLQAYINKKVFQLAPDLSNVSTYLLDKELAAVNVAADLGRYADAISGYISGTVQAGNAIAKAIGEIQDGVAQIKALIREALAAVPHEITLHYDWSPELQSAPQDSPIFVNEYDGESATCDFHVTITKKVLTPDGGVDNSPPEADASCVLRNFSIVLIPSLPMMTVGFEEISFTSHNGGSPVVNVKFGGVELSSDLSFVSALEAYFDPDSGFYIDPQPSRLTVGYGLPIPDLTVGAMSIVQLSFNTAVVLPFEGGETRARFAVSERNHPFLIAVTIYGGGGFFAIEASPSGIKAIEASFEFGGIAALSVAGLASGIAYVMAGIYFRDDNGDVTLTGFFDAGGNFDVIGMIQINIDFYLGLTYHNGNAYGEVIVTVEIGFTFFSITVQLRQTKTIAGSGRSGGSHHDEFHLLGFERANDVPASQSGSGTGSKSISAPTADVIFDSWKKWRQQDFVWE